MAKRTLSAPLAIVKVTGTDGALVTIGKMKSLRATESFTRGRVVGLGEITPDELPVLGWNGTVNVGQYAITLNTGILNSINRNFSTPADFVKNLLFNEGIQIDLLKKVKQTDGTFTEETVASIVDAHLTSEGLEVSEGQIGGRDAAFEYKTPILYGG